MLCPLTLSISSVLEKGCLSLKGCALCVSSVFRRAACIAGMPGVDTFEVEVSAAVLCIQLHAAFFLWQSDMH